MTIRSQLRENLILVFYVSLLVLFSISLWMLQLDLDEMITQVTDSLVGALEIILIISLILLLTKVITTVGQKVFTNNLQKYIKSEMDTLVMWQLSSYVIWIVAFILLFMIFTRDSTGLGVSLGIISAALVFILQRPLLNIAGWMVVIFNGPYAVGERIEINGRKGFVVEINLMYTKLREFGTLVGAESAYSGRYFTFPNAFVLEYDTVNFDKDMTYTWDEVKVSVTYESDHELARSLIHQAVEEVVGRHMRLASRLIRSKFEFQALKDRIIEEPQVFMRLADSSVSFYAIYFTDLSTRGKTKSEITERVLRSFAQHQSISIAYPHLHLVSAPEFQKGHHSDHMFGAAGSLPGSQPRQGFQTTLDGLSPKQNIPVAPETATEEPKKKRQSDTTGTIILPISRVAYREPLIRFLSGFAASHGWDVKVVNVIKMQRRRQRQIDMDAINAIEREITPITCKLKNVNHEIKTYYDPTQSILGMMADEKVKMLVIPWNSRILPSTELYDFLERARARPTESCDIVVIKGKQFPDKPGKILIPVGYGRNIVRFGKLLRRVAGQGGLELVLLGVATRPEDREKTLKRVDEFHTTALDSGVVDGKRLKVTREVVVSKNVAEVIQRVGSRCQLIALGATGRKDLKSYLFGSIPDIVLRGSNASVMVFQKGEKEE